ncbi:MAG: hypothetical protein AAF408_03645 [Pseudomonadota bacterium]
MKHKRWTFAQNVGEMMATNGALVAVAMVHFQGSMITRTVTEPVFVLGAGLAAFVSGFLSAPLFGQKGVIGLFLAAFGGILATLIGAGLAGMLILPDQNLELAITGLLLSFAFPPIFGLWLLATGLIHWQAGVMRNGSGQRTR